MEPRLIKVRYPTNCRHCGRAMSRGDAGWWRSDVKIMRCAACGPVDDADPRALDAAWRGIAGGSARAEHTRRRRNEVAAELTRHPRTGRLRLALRGEKQSTSAWEQGAAGEERVGARLSQLESRGAVVLHDRRMPGRSSNIDHIVVAPSAVWVVDSKRYRGLLERRDVGGWFRRDERLYVNGRDQSKLIAAMSGQVMAVRNALSPATPRIRAVLCFTGTEWPSMASPFELDGVVVTWPRALVKEIRDAASTGVDVNATAAQLAVRLRPARAFDHHPG